MNLTEELIASNVRIALFMGWKLDDTFPDKGKVYRSLRNNIELASTFKFHYDWNWIMPVIHAIRTKVTGCIVTMNDAYGYNECTITNNGFMPEITVTNEETILISTYKAIIFFLNWYENQ